MSRLPPRTCRAVLHRNILLLATALCSACSGWSPHGDGGPPPGTLDVSSIEDAVPRHEPRSRYGNPDSYEALGRRYHVLKDASGYRARGGASWYGTKFHGQRTSSGEIYDMYGMTAAHRSLPIPSYVKVTNLDNGRSTVVRVNDRGPFHEDRIIDLSYAAAAKLGILANGTGHVEVTVVDTAPRPAPRTLAEETITGPVLLQIGAYSDRRNAENLRVRLRGKQLPAVRVATTALAGQALYRVQIGPVADLREARAIQKRLRGYGIEQSSIVSPETTGSLPAPPGDG